MIDRPVRGPLLLGALLAAALAGCGGDGGVHEITDVRSQRDAPPPAPRSTTDQRMRADALPADPHGGGMPGGGRAGRPSWTSSAPAGWEALPEAPMRDLGWRVAGNPDAECTFSALPSGGGGLAANVNRWRKQMSLPPVDDAAAAALPKKGTMLGRPATWVELEGTYVGMRGDKRLEGSKLLGMIVELPVATAFLKLTGPAAVVDAETAHFLELAASLGMSTAAPPSEEPAAPRAGAPFRWTAPEGWAEQPPKVMRVVTFVPAKAPSSEAYAAVLKGTAGGLRANLDRWRSQIGLDKLSDAEFDALPRAKILGGTAVFLVAEGTFGGMSGTEAKAGSMLLGMALQRESDMVFVKMTGPAAEVRGEQERFRAFCESLHE